jgi:hypothetical protein
MTTNKSQDEAILALAYKRALIPVLNTILRMLHADAVFLWEVFDAARPMKLKGRKKNYRRRKEQNEDIPLSERGVAEIDSDEKERLCTEFYKFVLDKESGLLPSDSTSKKNPQHKQVAKQIMKALAGQYTILKFVEAVSKEDDFEVERLVKPDGSTEPREENFEPIEFGYGESARPRKYVVLDDPVILQRTFNLRMEEFKPTARRSNSKRDSLHKFIGLEGLTAYHVRTGSWGSYTRSQLDGPLQRLSIGLNHDRIILKRKPGGTPIDRCRRLCLLPIKYGDNVIGIIKAEIYSDTHDFPTGNIKRVRDMLPYLAEFIVHSRAGVKALTYKDLCKGSALLDALIRVRNSKEIKKRGETDPVYQVVDRLTHVFHVFKRGTYIGWAEIAGRVNHFVQEIGPLLHLKETDLLAKFEQFRRYDELLIEDVIQYREHFVHQFHTFVLGLIIILRIGIEQFVNWANDQLEARERIFRHPYQKLDAVSVIRIWFLTSFYHDYAYILERFDQNMSGFIESVLRVKPFVVKDDWSQALLSTLRDDQNVNTGPPSSLSTYLIKMSSYFVDGRDKSIAKTRSNTKARKGRNYEKAPAVRTHAADFVDAIWQAVVGRQDHGPLSALVMLDAIAREESKTNVKLGRLNEAYIAATAVACHHRGVFERVGHVYGESYLTLEGFPFTFLLTYCDTAQEWGRRKKEEDSSPWLEGIAVIKATANKPGLVRTTICYDSSMGNQVPDPEVIKERVKAWQQTFRSHYYRFVIEYWQAKGGNLNEDDKSRITTIEIEPKSSTSSREN